MKEACARPRVISGFSVKRSFRFLEETLLRAVEGTLNMGVWEERGGWGVARLVSVGSEGYTAACRRTGGREEGRSRRGTVLLVSA